MWSFIMLTVPESFDLAGAIALHNSRHKNKLKFTKTWGLKFLNPKKLNWLQNGFDLIRDSIHYKAPLHQNNHYEELLTIKKDLDQSNTFARIKSLTQTLKNEKKQTKHLLWEKTHVNFLNDANNWLNIADISVIKANQNRQRTVKELQTLWSQQAYFAAHSNEALIWVMPIIKELHVGLSLALKELKKNYKKLPTTIAGTYHSYLMNSLNAVAKLNQALFEAMYTRLLVWDKSEYKHADTTWYMVERLKLLEAFKAEKAFPPPRQYLTNSDVLHFQQAIAQYGNESLRTKANKLSWFKAQGILPTKTIMVDKTPLLIPTGLRQYLPYFRNAFFRQFPSVGKRVEFFKQRQKLFIVLKQPLPVFSDYLDLDLWQSDKRLQQLLHEQRLLIQEITSLENATYSWWQFGFKKLTQIWKLQVQERLKICVKEQLKLFEHLSDHLPSEQPDIISANPLVMQQQHAVWQSFKDLQAIIKQYSFLNDFTNPTGNLLKKLEKQLRQTPEAAMMDLLKLGEQKILKPFEYEFMSRVMNTLKQNFRIDSENFCHNYAQGATKNLLREVHNLLKVKNDLIHTSLISQYTEFIIEFGNREAIAKFNSLILKHLIENISLYSPYEVEQWILKNGSAELKKLFQLLIELREQKEVAAYKHTFDALLKTQAEKFLTRYIDKQALALEKELEMELAQSSTCQAHFKLLSQLTQRLIDTNSHQLETLDLQPYEKVSINKMTQSAKPSLLSTTIELRAKTALTVKAIQNSATLQEKFELLEALQHEVKKVTPHYSYFFSKRCGQQLLKNINSEEYNHAKVSYCHA